MLIENDWHNLPKLTLKTGPYRAFFNTFRLRRTLSLQNNNLSEI